MKVNGRFVHGKQSNCDLYLQKLYRCLCLNQSSTPDVIMHVHNDLKSHQFYILNTSVTGKLPEKLLQAVEKVFMKWSLKLHEQEWN